MFKHMKIGHRLILGFSLILFVMAVVIVTGIMALKKTQAELETVVIYENVRTQLANDMIVHTQETALHVRAILLLAYGKQSQEKIRQAQEQLAETRKTYSASYAELKKLCLLEESLSIQCDDDAQFARMEALADSSRRLQDIGIELALAGRMADATAAITGKAFPVVQRWIRTTEDMIDNEIRRTVLAYDEANKRYDRMRTFMLALGALALALALALSLALTRSIIVPIKVATRLVISRGQGMDLSAYKEGRDELSEMILAFKRNITERKRAEDDLHVAEQDFTKMFEKANDGMFVADLETKKFVFGNSACLKMLGLTQEEFLSRDLSDIHPPEELPIIFQKIENFMRGEDDIRMDCRFKHKDGTQLFTDLSPTLINYKGKKSILITFKDITGRKRAEEALRSSNEKLALFMKHSPIYAYIKEVTPTASRVLMASENFQDMIGIPGSKMTGKTMEELFPAETAAKMTADDWATASNGNVLKLDEALNGRNYSTIKFPITQDGKTLLAGYTIDITERKALENERERLIAGLQDSLDNIKTLKGLVPICASCKKIRNDGGYWQQVEEYVAEHTEADFSHGICDECAHKLYPDYFPDKQNEPPK